MWSDASEEKASRRILRSSCELSSSANDRDIFLSGMDSYCENKRTIGMEDGGMAIGPCPKFGKSGLQEYLEKGE